MLRFLDAMLFYMARWREEEKAKRESLADIKRNHWRCKEVERVECMRKNRSWRYANGNYR